MASLLRNSQTSRRHAPSTLSSFRAQTPRRIGATSATAAARSGSGALANIRLRPRCSRASASVTISMVRS